MFINSLNKINLSILNIEYQIVNKKYQCKLQWNLKVSKIIFFCITVKKQKLF